MVRAMSAIVILAAMSAGCRGTQVNTRQGTWELLGTRMVNHLADHDVVLAGLQGTFRRIRIDVDRADLEMWDVKVHFANGDVQDVAVRHHFREGSWSRQVDLPGASRIIAKVEFRYRTAHRGEGRAKVSVWGLH